MEKMDWTEWEKECASLKDKYDALEKKLNDANKTFDKIFAHRGRYVLISVFDGSETVFVQKFDNIFDTISEIKFNNRFGFRSYLKYDLSISIDLTNIYNGIKDIIGE